MAQSYDFELYAHPSIYVPTEKARERKLTIYFSEPDNGVNQETGLLLMISGFGGHANSNVYQKMRTQFADNYNLITVQCDYFGWEFMQTPENITIPKEHFEQLFSVEEQNYILQADNPFFRLSELCFKYNYIFQAREKLNENMNNFNDMGIMQAIDNISAVIAVLEILKDNNYHINTNKMMIYGHSHGAYLGYLCNAFAPYLFSMIIDNSAWLFPTYLYKLRCFHSHACLHTYFDYLARKTDYDPELLTLNSLYKKFQNNCEVICFHGTNDTLIPIDEKEKFINLLNNATLYKISANEVDEQIFKSTAHGLDADFIKLFEFVFEHHLPTSLTKTKLTENIIYQTAHKHYFFDYSKGLPIITIK